MAEGVASRIEDAAVQALDEGVRDRVFPGASASIGVYRNKGWDFVDVAAGELGEGLDAVTSGTLYDLASLTKPFVAMAALRLHQRGAMALEDPVQALVSEAVGLPVGDRTWEEVLSHRSGLAAWAPFYEALPHPAGSDAAQAWPIHELLSHWDPDEVGRPVYSDLGYILAGVAIARATGSTLDEVVRDEITEPLDITDGAFFGACQTDPSWKAACAPTGRSVWRRKALRGAVNDDNCAALGGVTGHAGMFGRARAVARFAAAQVAALHGRHGAAAEERIAHATARRPGGSQLLGWDGKAEEGSSAGSLIDADAFGHLGFTGTSVWCDPQRQLVVVLLTNRVAISDDNTAIRAFRPSFHDAVVQGFDGF
ncbi:MAG: serine hydrolase domain-containing protein [Myxococcota bacterium]